MKKISVLLIVFLCMFFGSMSVFAENSTMNEYDETTIVVTNTVGKVDYKVNDKIVKGQASESVKGITFVPVNIFTDALNASLKVDLKAKTAVITYNDVEIKLTDKKNEAVIAGKKVKMDAAPYIKNSVFMASVSFLADNLGADVINKNGVITFTKEIANPNSIKDFSTLIKKTAKAKVGDSYFKWTMMLPDDLKLDYRSFTGDMNDFVAQDESYYVYVYLYDREEDSTIEEIANSIYEDMDDYTLIDYGIKEQDGMEYVESIYKDESWTYQERMFLSDSKKFEILICTQNENSYSDEKYQNILNSFSLKYSNDGSTEDLSDITKEGYRKYQDTKLKWSINMLPEWDEYKNNNKQNEVVFSQDDSVMSLSIYSLEKNETLDSITNDSIERDKKRMNTDLYKVLKQETVTINGVNCNKVSYSIQVGDKLVYGWDMFFVNKNYKYIIGCEIPEENYNKIKQRRLVDGMLNSFKFTELDVKSVGKLLDPNKVTIAEKLKTISTDYYTVKLPSSFTEESGTDKSKSFASNDIFLSIYVTNSSLNNFINAFDEGVKERSDLKIISKVASTEKETTSYKYVLTVTNSNGGIFTEEVHIIEKNGTVVVVEQTVKSIFYGIKNKETMDSVWQSFALK